MVVEVLVVAVDSGRQMGAGASSMSWFGLNCLQCTPILVYSALNIASNFLFKLSLFSNHDTTTKHCKQVFLQVFLARWCNNNNNLKGKTHLTVPVSSSLSSSPSLSFSPFWPYAGSVLLAAACGNFVASFARSPYEIVKQRLQVVCGG